MTLRNLEFERALVEVDALPPASQVLVKILALTQEESASRSELIRCVSLDPAIAAKVLQTINSAYFGMGEKVSSLEVAVGLLGDKNIRDIAMMCSATGILRKSIGGYGMMADQFWLHSVTTAIAARQIAVRCGIEEDDSAFAAGLLHDIGKLAMNRVIMESQIEIEWDEENEIFPNYEFIENEAFGFDHCTIGYFVCRNWNFPENITTVIAFHHRPDLETDHRELVRVVNFADILAHLVSIGIDDPNFLILLGEEGRLPFEFSFQEIEDIFANLKTELDDSKAFLGI